jgi:hypothetical protein
LEDPEKDGKIKNALSFEVTITLFYVYEEEEEEIKYE